MGNKASTTKYGDTFLEIACGVSKNTAPRPSFASIAQSISRNILQSVRNTRGEGVVACACYNSDAWFLEYLIKFKFLWTTDNQKNNPLHTAVALENIEAVMKLCERWPELVTEKNASGQTPIDITTSPGIRKIMLDASQRIDNPFKDVDIPMELKSYFIHRSNIRDREMAGMSGGQSTIFVANLLFEDTSQKVVLKGVCPRIGNNKSLLRELKILMGACTTTTHPNIIPTLGFTIDDSSILLITPYTAAGDLDMWIRNNQLNYTYIGEAPLQDPPPPLHNLPYKMYTITDPQMQRLVLTFIQHIARGLNFLHKHNIIHNDIKPSNCLLFTEATSSSDLVGGITIKLIDFGLSVINEDPEFMNTPFFAPGTTLFQAPERFAQLGRLKIKPSIATDLFAFGATIWYLVNGKRPFYAIPARNKSHVLPKIPTGSYLGSEITSFVNRCIEHIPVGRPESLAELLELVLSTPTSEAQSSDVTRTSSSEFSSSVSSEEIVDGVVGVVGVDVPVSTTSLYHIPTPDDHGVSPLMSTPDVSLFMRELSAHVSVDNLNIISPNDVIYDEVIGEGNFGKVYRGRYNGKIVAIKVLKHLNSFSFDEQDAIRSEFIKESVALTKLANVERVSKIVGIVLDPMQIVMEYYPKRSIRDVLTNEGGMHYMTKLSLIKDIAEGLMNIHEVWGVHRDIAARNILVDDDYRAYISDFGKARFVEAVSSNITLDKVVAVKWASPETFSESGVVYSKYSDIWALGVTIYEILVGCEPYVDLKHQDLLKMLRDKAGKFLELPEMFDDELRHLVDKCLSWNPEDRGEAREHFGVVSRYMETLIKGKMYHGKKSPR